MDLSKTIRARREALNMTQAGLAMRSGVSRQSIVALESGGECRVSSLRRIAAVLDLELSLAPGDDCVKSEVGRKNRQRLPIPGERPDVMQLMNQVRLRQRQRAERVRAVVDALMSA